MNPADYKLTTLAIKNVYEKKNLNASRTPEHPPSGGKMSNRLPTIFYRQVNSALYSAQFLIHTRAN